MTNTQIIRVVWKNFGQTNPVIEKLTGLRWWQINRIRLQITARCRWRASRVFFSEAHDTVWVWRDDVDRGRVGLREIDCRLLWSMTNDQLMGLRVAHEQFSDKCHHALDAVGRTRRPRHDDSWRHMTRPGSHLSPLPELV